ncbi:MAG: NAD(P)/FAD-dependent oxidoreductase [Christensenellaceae bacterium]
MSKNVVVVGGGASGMLASYFSAKCGNNVTLIEQNEKLGKKLYITGKGRCNLTNDCDEQEFLSNVVTNSKFLSGAIYSFSTKDVMRLFESNGLKLKVERGNRVFPASDKSSDVIKCLSSMLVSVNVDVKLNEKVLTVDACDGKIKGVKSDKSYYAADKVIIATGGKSYSKTGSTGDGYKFAKMLGHNVTEPKPALSPIELKDDFCADLSGLSLKNVTLKAVKGSKVVHEEFGEMLFTHTGISGPITLTLSSRINKLNLSELSLFIDFKPALNAKQLDARLLRDFERLKNKQLKNSLQLLLPKSLIPFVLRLAEIDGEKPNNTVTKEERLRLVNTVKNFSLKIKGFAPIEQSIVTCGGVNVKEIQPKDMQSKLIGGLYFCGEVIDADALTGGFNLQIAFSTAYLAGMED